MYRHTSQISNSRLDPWGAEAIVHAARRTVELHKCNDMVLLQIDAKNAFFFFFFFMSGELV